MLALFALVAVFIGGTVAEGTWGYGETVPGEVYGPADWGHVSSFCDAKAQSPINIDTRNVIIKEVDNYDDGGELRIHFNNLFGNTEGTFSNNGHAPTLAVETGGASLVNPINGQNYKLAQFHFHFGCTDNVGSEHTVNGKAYPGEVHFVFYNSKYGSLGNAATKPDGLTVVGGFLQKYSFANYQLEELSLKLDSIKNEGSKVARVSTFLQYLLPMDYSDEYYSYKGSLTTPGCYESVSWIVLKNTIPVDYKVLNAFRQLKATHGKHHGKMCDNYRPTQPLNGRKVTFYRDD